VPRCCLHASSSLTSGPGAISPPVFLDPNLSYILNTWSNIMATSSVAGGAIALHGAPDRSLGSPSASMQAMQLVLDQDLIDELLESARRGSKPQLIFGRHPQLKYGDKSYALNTSLEPLRHEVYHASGPGSEDGLDCVGIIKHNLTVQKKAEDVTAGVDSALAQLKNSMAAMQELKEANKTIVADAAAVRTHAHRRIPSKSLRTPHLSQSPAGSPLLSAPSSPALKPPTSQPAGSHVLRALRVPLVHLLAVQPARESTLAETCRVPPSLLRELLPKIAKKSSDPEKWQLTDKACRELDPWKFSYKTQTERDQAINSAIKAFDRLRLAKDDKLWQLLLPAGERGQGKCLSRLTVKAPDQRPSTPLHKLPKLSDKKPAAAKQNDKVGEKESKVKVKEVVRAEAKSAGVKAHEVKEGAGVKPRNPPAQPIANRPHTPSNNTPRTSAPSHRHTPSEDAMFSGAGPNIRTRKVTVPSQKPRPSGVVRPSKALNTKPKNPSPLSVSPPVNASELDAKHPAHKALSGAPSPQKRISATSDRPLKRKVDDGPATLKGTKKPSRPGHTPTVAGRSDSTTSASLKRKADVSLTESTKKRKVGNVDTGLAASYSDSKTNDVSPTDSSSSGASSTSQLTFRQTVERSQLFQQRYKLYEELYWKLYTSATPPTDAQRKELMRMHKQIDDMKKEIEAGSGAAR
ncbi:hypothetical protein M011DRAFT_395068, partial [Sporormia fimetaria CBS 119925]